MCACYVDLDRSARDVKITDTLPEGSKLLSGSVSTTIRTIAEGSSAQNTYTISFTTGGSGMALPLASVSYLAEEGATQVRARSVRQDL